MHACMLIIAQFISFENQKEFVKALTGAVNINDYYV